MTILASRIPRIPPIGRVVLPEELRSADTVGLARWLLGKTLVRTLGGRRIASTIAEVEAYDSEKDLACHASRGRTPRTETLYCAGGVWYVYLVYGMHHLLNVVTGPEGRPAAVLIRAAGAVTGPGRLTKALGIDMALNRSPISPATGLHLEDAGTRPGRRVRSSPRIGVEYAGPIWSRKLWRFTYDPT
jgi:DNA-3-methyladenine glycosylase